MDPNSLKTMAAAAGAGSKEGEYVEEVFNTYVYDGTGSALSITNDIDISGEGGMVWVKRRDGSQAHTIGDTERTNMKVLEPNGDSGEYGGSNYISAYNSNGFSLGTDANTNANNQDYVSWTFRKAKGFFDVVQFTKSSDAAASFTHNLGCVPGMMIIKAVSKANHWSVWHKSLPDSDEDFLHLNESGAYETSSTRFGADPTATHFTVGSHNEFSGSNTYVAYLFADGDDSDAQIFGEKGDESIIKMGTYTGNGSTTGPEINLGWEPQFLIIKKSSASDSWQLKDVMRNFSVKQLLINSSGGEAPADEASRVDPTATGFAVKTSDGAFNSNSGTYVYMAIRRGPMKTPEDATKVFEPSAVTVNQGTQRTTSFPIDLVMAADRGSSGQGFALEDRLRRFAWANTTDISAKLKTAVTSTENTFQSPIVYDVTNNSIIEGGYFSGYDAIFYYFRRAPGFFDIVCYEGTGSARTLDHNLGVIPELVVVKNREGNYAWSVYVSHLSSPRTKKLHWSSNDAEDTVSAGTYWGNSDFTSTQISLGSYTETNQSAKDMVAYLFASLDGISKVGTYTGTGSAINIDCGFTGGARFVLIKRTDSSGDWWVWDTARGYSGTTDNYLELNNAIAEDANMSNVDNHLDTLSAGFTVRDSPEINVSSATYIYLAIA